MSLTLGQILPATKDSHAKRTGEKARPFGAESSVLVKDGNELPEEG